MSEDPRSLCSLQLSTAKENFSDLSFPIHSIEWRDFIAAMSRYCHLGMGEVEDWGIFPQTTMGMGTEFVRKQSNRQKLCMDIKKYCQLLEDMGPEENKFTQYPQHGGYTDTVVPVFRKMNFLSPEIQSYPRKQRATCSYIKERKGQNWVNNSVAIQREEKRRKRRIMARNYRKREERNLSSLLMQVQATDFLKP